MKQISFEDSREADLIVDAQYLSGRVGNLSDEVISKIMSVGTQGGFRPRGRNERKDFCVLVTSMEDKLWPDSIDIYNGMFTYYGDNKTPGNEIHEKDGNKILKYAFEQLHLENLENVFPFFVFKQLRNSYRDVQFLGIAVPGHPNINSKSDLVAEWGLENGERFQNYKAIFSILDVPTISREWLQSLIESDEKIELRPEAYDQFLRNGKYNLLKIDRPSLEVKTKEDQIPETNSDLEIIKTIKEFYTGREADFEVCAVELFKYYSHYPTQENVTKISGDGGKDAEGVIKFGKPIDAIDIDYALEAKCYGIDNVCSSKEVSRLISRIRQKMVGVFVTTSYVNPNTLKEVKEDNHPVIFITSADIVDILKEHEKNTVFKVKEWLENLDYSVRN
ncbi:MAG: restriction endonuclease [Alphaproteobacteria bacterium]